MTYHEYLTHIGYECQHSECRVERFDALDPTPELKRQYLAWLDQAPDADCPTVDVAHSLTIRIRGGSTYVRLPDTCRRFVRLRSYNWARDAMIVGPDHPIVPLLGNPYAQPGPEHPVAIRRGNEYEIIPAVASLESAVAVIPVWEPPN